MNQRQLYRTIENVASQSFETVEDLLKHVVEQIILNEEIQFRGGRIWKLTPSKKSYRLIYQTGEIEKIAENFSVRISEYPIFAQIGKQKTLTANETNQYLRKKGILKYALTGVGQRLKMGGQFLYPFLLAFNTPVEFNERSTYTLNIISSAVTNVLRRDKAEAKTKRLERDLDKAREIQKSILPEHSYMFGNYEIYGVSIAEQIVGGDFFDYIESEEEHDRVSIVIADAASKGLSAAVQALYVSGAIRMGTGFQVKIGPLLRKINNLVNRTFPDDRFVTLFYLDLIDNQNGLCVFANAGHNSPIHYISRGSSIEFLPATGSALGLAPNQSYRIENINLNMGDIVLLYTDGITEAMNTDYELFGEDKLSEKLIKYKDEPVEKICHLILQDVINYSQNASYSDDKTVVAIKRIK